jgi:glycosyltransferase involved in cell wall biosynthesis
MIYFDVTRTGNAAHRSGLTRVSTRLREEWPELVPVAWNAARRSLVPRGKSSDRALTLGGADWFLTVELFDHRERPGFAEFLAQASCRKAAVFHDAIPLRFPHITWPQSVQRHAGYLKLLAGFDRVLAVSRASRDELLSFWQWQQAAVRAGVATVELGADFDGAPRDLEHAAAAAARPSLLCVGIVEPRKNQGFLLDVAERLWGGGVDFELHVVGRVNPHFGKPIATRMRRLGQREARFRFHEAASDAQLRKLYARAHAVAFPTIAEGCGLPLIEALWRGVPCIASDLPVLRENADGGGCVLATVNDAGDWAAKIRDLISDGALHARLRAQVRSRGLPRWADTVASLKRNLA